VLDFYLIGHSTGAAVEEARERLRSAEARLAQGVTAQLEIDASPTPSERAGEGRLELAALWEVTHSRLDLYHQIATNQARRSFITAQAATGAGFSLLVAFAILATRAHTTAGALTTGSLGAVSAALAGYIGSTFVRSQEAAAAHLRTYFDQPLEFSKYLAAERLLANRADLSSDQRAAIVTALVQGILAIGPSASAGESRK
jgi:hypothetical protein